MSRFVVVLYAIFIATPAAFAKQPICNTVQECRDVISQLQARLQKLTDVNGSQRVSVTGAVFTRDTSNLALGEAYRDPSGLIWGNVVTTPQGKIERMTQYDAEKYCQSIGARLPTVEEFEQLAKYLGKGTAEGYDPYLTDGKTEILPEIADYAFWSASVNSNYRGDSWIFGSSNGSLPQLLRNGTFAVRCVGR